MPVSPARAAAFDILLRVERESSYASELLHSKTYTALSTQDHALATELVMGVLRWRSRLDDEIATASSQSLAKLDLEVLLAARLALYQFRWLDRIPKRAALNESVELVKRARKRSAAAFVNAVLRKLASKKAPAETKITTAQALAHEVAHPEWLVDRWVRRYGLEAAIEICKYDQSKPETAIRLRSTTAEAELVQHGVELLGGRILSSARTARGDIPRTKALRERGFVIQDEGSQLVAALVGKDLQTRILDCCAAPGGKTLAIADRNRQSRVTAVEFHPHRARLLRNLVRTATPDNAIQIIVADARQLPTPGIFDRVIADVPCSGTGTLARNPEIKWRLTAEDLADLHSRQAAILRSAMSQVAVGGHVIYSTCSLEKEENEDVIGEVLANNAGFHVVDCRQELNRLRSAGELLLPDVVPLTSGPYLCTIPGIHPCDGFFAAILGKE
jgi:16S rRNA (cytosine967-C5)-methyltransferase